MDQRMSSIIRLQFDFKDRAPEDLDQLNRILAAMELTDVDVEDVNGYLATTQEYQGDRVVNTTYRYGLDNGILVCKKDDCGQTHRFQVTTMVFEGANAMRGRAFEEYWRAQYPERMLSTVVTVGFAQQTALVVVYFE